MLFKGEIIEGINARRDINIHENTLFGRGWAVKISCITSMDEGHEQCSPALVKSSPKPLKKRLAMALENYSENRYSYKDALQ